MLGNKLTSLLHGGSIADDEARLRFIVRVLRAVVIKGLEVGSSLQPLVPCFQLTALVSAVGSALAGMIQARKGGKLLHGSSGSMLVSFKRARSQSQGDLYEPQKKELRGSKRKRGVDG